MPVQIWIQTQKENVQKIKLILEEARQLSKAQKVKAGAQDGEKRSIKVNAFTDDERVHDTSHQHISR
jgi:hypothetical protein